MESCEAWLEELNELTMAEMGELVDAFNHLPLMSWFETDVTVDEAFEWLYDDWMRQAGEAE